jgi:hypothetical protein
LRIPLDGRFVFVLTGVVSNCFTPSGIASILGCVFCPEIANFLPGFLTGISILNLKHGDEFIEFHVRFIHFDQVVLNHQAPPGVDLTANQLPIFFEQCFVHHDVILLIFIKRFNAPSQGVLFGYSRYWELHDFVYKRLFFPPQYGKQNLQTLSPCGELV